MNKLRKLHTCRCTIYLNIAGVIVTVL